MTKEKASKWKIGTAKGICSQISKPSASSASTSCELAITIVEKQPDETLDENDNNVSGQENLGEGNNAASEPDNLGKGTDAVNDNNMSDSVTAQQPCAWNIYDPANWECLDDKARAILVEKGPIGEENLVSRSDDSFIFYKQLLLFFMYTCPIMWVYCFIWRVGELSASSTCDQHTSKAHSLVLLTHIRTCMQ